MAELKRVEERFLALGPGREGEVFAGAQVNSRRTLEEVVAVCRALQAAVETAHKFVLAAEAEVNPETRNPKLVYAHNYVLAALRGLEV